MTETSRSIPWLLIALVTALIAVIVGVLVLVTGGSSGTEQPPAVATASPAPATGESTVAAAPVPPVVTDLRKVFVRPVTTWSVIAHDPVGGALTYVWLLTPDVPTERCGKPLAPWTQTGPQATWSHDSIPPDNCPAHLTTDHAVTVTVTNQQGLSVVCTMKGTESEDLQNPSCR